MGEEEFYIDNITNLFIEDVLTEEEKEFNLNILYGKETSVDQIISICKKYPLMSKHQIVLVKEAQDFSRTIEKLEADLVDNKYYFFSIEKNDNKINIFFDKNTYNLIGWQTEDIYQNLVITFIDNIKKNSKIDDKLFKLPKQH